MFNLFMNSLMISSLLFTILNLLLPASFYYQFLSIGVHCHLLHERLKEMTNTSRRRVGRYQKDRPGCMSGLMSIFDFRHVRPSHQLISDRRHGSRRTSGIAYARNKIQIVEDLYKSCEDINVSEHDETASVDSSKVSVKELMAEEMWGDQDQKKQAGCGEEDPKLSAIGPADYPKKNRRRTSKRSLDLDDLRAAEGSKFERPVHQKHKSLSSLDLNIMVEELCSQIEQKKIDRSKHEQDDELSVHLNDDSSDVEEILKEATRVFVDHFNHGKVFTKDRKVQPSRELLDALQVLSSNKEVFLKLLQDPSSLLVKSLQDFQVDNDENSEVLPSVSNSFKNDIGQSKQQRFWRMFKGLERISSKKIENAHDLSRIVVLKPEPTDMENLENANTCSSLHQLQQRPEHNDQTDRSSSTFSFSDFRRKWRFRARKEQSGIGPKGTPHLLPYEQSSSRNGHKAVNRENNGMTSPSRDHFFIERIPKASGIKKGGKVESPRHKRIPLENENELRASNIYAEARKHLAEIVGNSDVDVDFLSRQVPRSLGRILNFPDYNSPICSPRKTGNNSLVAAEMRLSPQHKCDVGTEQRMQETGGNDLVGPAERGTERQSYMHAEKPDEEVVPNSSNTGTFKGLICEHDVDRTLDLDIDETNAEGGSGSSTEILTSNKAGVAKGSTHLDIPIEPCVASTTIVQIDGVPKLEEEEEYSTNLELDTLEQSGSLFSPALSPPRTQKAEDFDASNDRAGQPSPVSVLETSFIDDISPPGIKSSSGIYPLMPRQIHFDEQAQTSPPPDQPSAMDDNKNSIFESVKAVVQKYGLTWDELLERSLFSDCIIDPSLFDELDFLPDHLFLDPRLVFDLIDEVIMDICWYNYGCILSFGNLYAGPELKGKDIAGEIWEGAEWYLEMQGGATTRTIEQVVAKDFAKDASWMDLRFDTEDIDIEMEEVILQELVEDTISCCMVNLRQEFGLPVLVSESEESDREGSACV